MIYTFEGIEPEIDPSCFIAPGAVIVGDVKIGPQSSAWFNTVIRGDVNSIRIGARTNIQDGCILHVRKDLYPMIVGDEVTFGHGVVAQGCRISSHVLIGMGAVLLDNCSLGEYCIVAAGAVVPEDSVIPPGSLVVGLPGKVKREITSEEKSAIDRHAQNYVRYSTRYGAEGFREVRKG